MSKIEDQGRRHILRGGAAAAIFMLTGCGGSPGVAASSTTSSVAPASDPSTTTTAPGSEATTSPPATPLWNVVVPMLNVAGTSTFDLSTTLPIGVARGGSFGVDPGGASLPIGMTLSPGGILSVGTSTVSTAVGIIFFYETV